MKQSCNKKEKKTNIYLKKGKNQKKKEKHFNNQNFFKHLKNEINI